MSFGCGRAGRDLHGQAQGKRRFACPALGLVSSLACIPPLRLCGFALRGFFATPQKPPPRGIPLALGTAWALCPVLPALRAYAQLGELLGCERETYNARLRLHGYRVSAFSLALSQVYALWPSLNSTACASFFMSWPPLAAGLCASAPASLSHRGAPAFDRVLFSFSCGCWKKPMRPLMCCIEPLTATLPASWACHRGYSPVQIRFAHLAAASVPKTLDKPPLAGCSVARLKQLNGAGFSKNQHL